MHGHETIASVNVSAISSFLPYEKPPKWMHQLVVSLIIAMLQGTPTSLHTHNVPCHLRLKFATSLDT